MYTNIYLVKEENIYAKILRVFKIKNPLTLPPLPTPAPPHPLPTPPLFTISGVVGPRCLWC